MYLSCDNMLKECVLSVRVDEAERDLFFFMYMSEVYFLVLEDGRMKQVASLRGEVAEVEELTGAALFLASNASKYMIKKKRLWYLCSAIASHQCIYSSVERGTS